MPVTADITVSPHTILHQLLGRGLAVARMECANRHV
jgi:hypothetical protein